MEQLMVYVHGKGGNAGEAEHYKPLFPKSTVIGFDYKAQTPWEAKEDFLAFFEQQRDYDSVIITANSIGAFFTMSALSQSHYEKTIDQALFISPIVDMEKLIRNMMGFAKVTEEELCRRKEIPTNFGETLSWEYLCYVREHPIGWSVPTRILYGEHDNLTDYETVSAFAKRTGACLTVMKDGEHWFHTTEQMKFLDNWVKNS